MNIPNLISQHETAIEKLQEIARLKKMRDSLTQDAEGFAGKNFPDKKDEWLKGAARYQQRIYDEMVSYRGYMNSIR